MPKSQRSQPSVPKGEYTPAELAVSWEQFPGITDDLPVLAAEYLSLSREIKEMETRKSALKLELETIMEATGEKVVAGEFFVTERCLGHLPKKLSPEKLLENGVKMEAIEASWIKGAEYHYIRVLERKGEE